MDANALSQKGFDTLVCVARMFDDKCEQYFDNQDLFTVYDEADDSFLTSTFAWVTHDYLDSLNESYPSTAAGIVIYALKQEIVLSDSDYRYDKTLFDYDSVGEVAAQVLYEDMFWYMKHDGRKPELCPIWSMVKPKKAK